MLVKRYLGSFSEVTGFKSEVKNFRMLWFDRLELDDISIYDPDNNKMIGVKKLLINFKLSHLFKHSDVNIDGVFVDGAEVFLTDVKATDSTQQLNINEWIDRISAQFSSDTTSTGSFTMRIGEAYVNQSIFKYADPEKDSIKNGFDYYHFTLNVDEGQLERFEVIGDTTEFDLNTLIIEDKATKFKIDQLSTFFRSCKTSMEYRGIELHAGKSLVKDTVLFSYNDWSDFPNFNQKVNVHAHLTQSVIDPKDLAIFAPGVEKINQLINVTGIADGRVDKFKVKDMDIALGNTRFQGNVDMDGLPDIDETFINVNLKKSHVLFSDLSFVLNDEVLAQLEPLGRLSLDGQFIGYPTDFVANGKFNSKLGLISSDMNFKVDEGNFDHSIYSGKLALVDFQLGTYLNDTVTFQKINMNGRVNGSGLNTATADFTLDGTVNSIGVLGYNYININTNGRFSAQSFSGMLNINDPNLKFKAQGSIDLRENKNIVKVQATLDTAVLNNLTLTKEKISLHADMNINIKGFQIDSLVGTADFSDFMIRYDEEQLGLKNIHLSSLKTGRERSISLQTTLVDAEVKGDFLFSDLTVDVRTLVKEILLNVKNDKEATRKYYESKTDLPKDYETTFNVKLKDITGIADLIDIDFQLSPNVSVDGKFSSGKTTIIQIFSSIDSLEYNGSQFAHNDIELTASKISDSTSVLAMLYVNSDKQFYGPNFQTENLSVEGIWDKSHIDFSLDADQKENNNSLRLKGGIDFQPDSTIIKLQPSSLKVLKSQWSFDPYNAIVFSNNEWFFQNVKLEEEGQSIGLTGYLSEDPNKKILLEVNHLNLAILDVITGLKFTGTLDAKTELRNYSLDASLQNDIFIDSLTINKFLVGDITGKNIWSTQEKRFDINFFIDRVQSRIVNLSGYYNPSDDESPLNVTAQLEKAEVKIIEPFLDDMFSQWGGTATGHYQIRGKLNEPDIEGEAEVVNGQMMVNYLKTQYRFHGKVAIKKNSIHFKQFEIIDGFKNKGTIEGAIVHKNYTDFKITLDANFRNIQVLNTSAKDNDLFYGQAYATGTVNFSGPFSNLKISGQAKSQKNTRIYIPINTSSSVNKKEFINFVNLSDTLFLKKFKKDLNNKISLSNLTFDMNLDITPDAYCEIILDMKAGDIIRGRGNGELQLQLDTKGDFNMYGFFEFTQGWYNFTLYDIINKEFEIQSGSRITWFGDPYGATLNINASYHQMAMFGPIIQNTEYATAPQLRRKYQALVLLKLDGPMLSPNINFDLQAKDLPKNMSVTAPNSPTTSITLNLDFEFKAFRSKLDEQELKRQVFSLIVLKRFSPPDQFSTQGSIANSVSELFSNQLSNWMTQVDENLEIDVDLGSFDQEAFNTFQLRLSYTFLNGRLRITRDGTFNNNSPNNASNNNNNSSNASSIAGDWTVDYLLTADGKFKVKMYNRTNVNPILNTIGTQNTFTTGVSLLYTQSFNEIKDLLQSARTKRRREQEKAAAANQNAIKVKEEDDGTD
jgi:hypothetical protein